MLVDFDWTFADRRTLFGGAANADRFRGCGSVSLLLFERYVGPRHHNATMPLGRTALCFILGGYGAQRGSLGQHLRLLQKLCLLLDELKFLRHPLFFIKRDLNVICPLLWLQQSIDGGAELLDEGDLVRSVHFVLAQLQVSLLVRLSYLRLRLFLSLSLVVLTAQLWRANYGVEVLQVSPDLHVLLRQLLYLCIAALKLFL